MIFSKPVDISKIVRVTGNQQNILGVSFLDSKLGEYGKQIAIYGENKVLEQVFDGLLYYFLPTNSK